MTVANVKIESKILNRFPDMADEFKDYILGIIRENVADFHSSADVYEAIGEILLATNCDKTSCGEKDIVQFCDELAEMLILENAPKSVKSTKLDAPRNLNLADNDTDDNSNQGGGIWSVNKLVNNLSAADLKKLEKVDNKLKQKLDKKAQESNVPNGASSFQQDCTATVSQAVNRRDMKFDSSPDIKIENFDIVFGDRRLLVEANLTLVCGRRYGLVGRNGLGKTTLLKMISNGSLYIPARITILHVEQEVNGDDTPVLESVLESDEKRKRLIEEERKIQKRLNELKGDESSCQKNEQIIKEDSSRLHDIYEELEASEADKAPAKAAAILFGLGFNSEAQKRPTKEFSGGWRMRLALARALFLQPDLLLLDEPTNMLDIKAIYWLESYLQSWKKTLLVVSHDRNFLNEISTDVIFLYNQKLDHYVGNYDNFEKAKEEKLKNELREYDAQKQLREHVQVFIDRFRYNANRAALVQSKIKMLERLPVLAPIQVDSDVIFNFPICDKLNPPVLQMDDIIFRYKATNTDRINAGQNIFEKCCFNADMESRICIVGENGAGKTTLLKLLNGDLEPTDGYCRRHRNLKIAYFTQHHVDQLVFNQNPVQLMQTRFPGSPVEFYRAALGRFGISGDLALQSIDTLSGGQKSRLAFAIICMQNPNFLILDEPTNHLDIESVEALGKAISTFTGGVILVSHDERLIELVCKELWLVKNRSIKRLDGGLKEYKKLIEQELAEMK